IESNVDNLFQTGGVAFLEGTATLATGKLDGGKLWYNSSGTATDIDCHGGDVDMSGDFRPFIVTNVEVKKGKWWDPNARVTYTNPIEFPNGFLSDSTVNFGYGKKHTIAAI
ncbi:MAG: hypothetical protein KAJ19_27625, partial [Gammaproteobacteria bacterium]|nr:hypothetical protein [Gammaproteobacteria bacterium]